MPSLQPADYPGAQPWVPERPTLALLRPAAEQCRGCDLFKDATQVVMGDGPAGAPLVPVGEQPGDQEDQQGLPFVGPAGRLLDGALEQADIDPATVFRTNSVKHFRFHVSGKRRIHESPSRWQVASCQPWSLAELDVVSPQVVVLLGATAGQAVYGPSFRVGASRGRPMEWPADAPRLKQPPVVLATAHPSSVLRSRRRDEDLAALVSDLRVAAELIG
jgi:DNA polymerase